ncbi:hypothetical protein PV08_03518 [Exophiala spinifera]|uniref:Uncharacterized protein n=1 Tax=Exophiala spinifera TaxID=91928 RepID=A0A0D2C6L6_9EURO|nr:uncharacterized protein PV08_03518 [Exophiala spinifera]KIW19224.1 hypothetical protein PV08_03518 [Exophiala spinifera]
MHIQSIPREHISTLTKILQFPPDVEAREHIKSLASLVKLLPYTLRTSRAERIILRTQGSLCSLHNFLDLETVQTILGKIKVEIGSRLNSIVSQRQLLSPEQGNCITQLRHLHALWIPQYEFEKTFLCRTAETNWTYETSRCEACIISRIAGDLESLLNLRCTVRSRATSKHVAKHGFPRLQVWIDNWIEHLHHRFSGTGQIMDLDKVIAKNDEDGAALMTARSKVHEFRTQQHGIVHVDLLKHGQHARPGKQPLNETVDDESDASADPSSKGQSPYGNRTSLKRGKSEMVYSVDLETLASGPSRMQKCEFGVKEEEEEEEEEEEQRPYIPPRQNWNKNRVSRTSTVPRPAAQPNPRGRPARRDSWETESLESTYFSGATSSLYPRPQKRAAPAAPAATTTRAPRPRGGPAETYEKLIGPFPADSVAETIGLYSNADDNSRRSGEPDPGALETLPQTTYDPRRSLDAHAYAHWHSASQSRAPSPSPSTASYTTTDSDFTFEELGQGSAATTAIFILDESSGESGGMSSSPTSPPPRPRPQQQQAQLSPCSSSRWEDFYESQTRLRDDLDWFYHQEGK